VLVPLFERDGLRLGELAAASRLSKQAMTGLVKRCEADGLVERERDPGDGRAFNVRLTARGRAFRAVVEQILGELDAALVQSMGTRNRDALSRALKDGMTRDPLSSSADDPRRCQTVELEEAPCDDRNGI
jgi:DNA-binding MarR family transcriptional regulator